MELLLAALLIVMLVVAVFSRQLLHAPHWINPLTAFNLPQALLLASFIIGTAREAFVFQLKPVHVALLALGYVSFNIAVISLAQMRTRRSAIPESWPDQLRAAKRLMRISLVALFCCIIHKYYILLTTYGNLLGSIVAIRRDYVSGVLAYGFSNSLAFTSSNLLVLMLGVMEGARYRYRYRRSTLLLAAMFIIANDFTIGGANWTFAALVLYMCAWGVTRERVSEITWRDTRRVIIGMVLATSAVFTLLSLRSKGSIGTHTSFLDVVLYYAGGDIATFGYFIDSPYPSIPPGRFTLGGLYEFANDFTALFGSPVLGDIDDVDMIADIGTTSNTSIHLAAYYSDFRSPGIIGFSAILGFVSMWTMANCARCNVVRLQYCALLLFVCVMAIRGTPTEGKYFWTLLIVLPIVHRVARYRFRTFHARIPVPPHAVIADKYHGRGAAKKKAPGSGGLGT